MTDIDIDKCAADARADRAVEAWKEANGYDDLLSAYSAAGDRIAALEKVVRSAANLLDGTDAVTLYPTGFVACAFNELRAALGSAQPAPDAGITRDGIAAAENTARLFEPAPDARDERIRELEAGRSKVLVKRIRELEHLIDLQRRKIGALEGELDAAKSDARFGHDLAKGRAERIRVACAELRKLEGKDSPGEHPEKEQENGRDGTDDTGPRIPQPLVREEAGAECDDTDLSGDGRGADAAGAPSETGDAAGERGDGARRTRAPGGGGVHGQQVDSDSGQPASMSEQSRSESTRAGCSSPPTGGLLDSSVIRDLVTLALDMPNSIRFARSDEAYAAAQRLLARYPR